MIETREDLKRYLAMDCHAMGRKPTFFSYGNEILTFQRILRYHEYYFNNKNKTVFHWLLSKFYGYRHRKLGIRLGFDIPVNVFEGGLRINHYGLIVVNEHARIGKYCDIHQGVNIGQQGECDCDVPIIGDNVWIGPGAKIFGRIHVADECQIGANAVVNKSFEQKGVTIAGVPAKVISNNSNPHKRNFYIKKS